MSSDGVVFDDVVVNQPTLSPDGPLSNKPWRYLTRFEVTCQAREKVLCPVYANGRQQVPIQINIEARDEDDVVVDVNHPKLYLNLGSYENTDVIPSDLVRSGTEDSRFIYNWQVGPAGAGEDAPAHREDVETLQSVTQFVSAKKVGVYKLAARCSSPEGTVFTTNTRNPGPGKFDSWVLVDAREPVIITWDKLAMSGPRNVYTHFPFDIDLYYVYFNDPLNTGLRIVEAINYRAADDTCHYAWMKGVRRFEQAAFRVLPARTLSYKSCHHSASFRLGEHPGRADVGRIRNNLGGPCGNYSYQHGLVGYINQYGNETQVVLRAASDGNTISLASPRVLEEGTEAPPADDE